MIMPALLLQKPSPKSKSKDHADALKRRLHLWEKGDFLELLQECQTLQNRLKSGSPPRSDEAISKKFANLMKAGRANAAIKLLTENMEGGVLPLNAETMLLLESKHPEPQDLNPDSIIHEQSPEVHPIVFETIDGESARIAALNTHGGSGPSGMDGDAWRHIMVSKRYGLVSEEFRNVFAQFVRSLCTEKVQVESAHRSPTSSLEAFLACR